MAEMTKKALNKIKAAAFTEFKQGFSEEDMLGIQQERQRTTPQP